MAYIFLDCVHSFHREYLPICTQMCDNLEVRLFIFGCLLPQLLLAVGTKLEHIITELAHEVAEKHVAIEGDLVVNPSDDHFWFNRPQIALFLIHFILFQNAFEIAFFFWIWVSYFRSLHIFFFILLTTSLCS